jgi:hypothetical protein
LRRVGAVLSGAVDRVSVAPGQLTPCLVGDLGLGLGLTPDELELVDHPRPGLLAAAGFSCMNEIAPQRRDRDTPAHATALRSSPVGERALRRALDARIA